MREGFNINIVSWALAAKQNWSSSTALTGSNYSPKSCKIEMYVYGVLMQGSNIQDDTRKCISWLFKWPQVSQKNINYKKWIMTCIVCIWEKTHKTCKPIGDITTGRTKKQGAIK